MGDDVNYDKSKLNDFVQDLYNQKMQEGKHGHYETMFHVVHKAIERANPVAFSVGYLTDADIDELQKKHLVLAVNYDMRLAGLAGVHEFARAILEFATRAGGMK